MVSPAGFVHSVEQECKHGSKVAVSGGLGPLGLGETAVVVVDISFAEQAVQVDWRRT